jgi:hypothetical protein
MKGKREVQKKIDLKETSCLKRLLTVLLAMGVFFLWPTIFNALPKSLSDPLPISSLKIDTPVELCGERVPLEIQEVRERLEKELLLTLWDRPQVILWLKRSRRYLPYIDEMLKKNGMPADLKYIALAESALRPHAGSPKGAMGFWQFYLPLETQRYVLRIISIKLIFSDPKRYGFNLSNEDYYPPLEFDRVQIKCLRDTHLRIIAQAAKTHFKEIKDLNPEIRGYFLSAGKHTILIPKGASQGFETRYQALLHDEPTDPKEQIYVVHEADTLSSIANRFGVPLPSIIRWNRLNPATSIRPGDKLIIYRSREEPFERDEEEGKGASPVND